VSSTIAIATPTINSSLKRQAVDLDLDCEKEKDENTSTV
jgi:hypothetical protein